MVDESPAVPAPRLGFTLVEMMIASAVSVLVLLAVLGTFSQYRRSFAQKKLEQEIQQNARNAVNLIQRDLRLCGSGLVMGTSSLGNWFTGMTGVDRLPVITEGTPGDTLVTLGYAGAPVGELAAGVTAGATGIEVTLDQDGISPYEPAVGDVLVVGSLEAVVVTAVSGSRLSVSTAPAGTGGGLRLSYPSGMEVFEINRVTYSLGVINGETGLLRDDSRFTYGERADQLIAPGIEAFQVSRNGNLITFTLTARSRKPVPGLPAGGDEHVRYTLTGQHEIRNPTPFIKISHWDPDILVSSPTP